MCRALLGLQGFVLWPAGKACPAPGLRGASARPSVLPYVSFLSETAETGCCRGWHHHFPPPCQLQLLQGTQGGGQQTKSTSWSPSSRGPDGPRATTITVSLSPMSSHGFGRWRLRTCFGLLWVYRQVGGSCRHGSCLCAKHSSSSKLPLAPLGTGMDGLGPKLSLKISLCCWSRSVWRPGCGGNEDLTRLGWARVHRMV